MISSAFIRVNLRPNFFHTSHAPVFTFHEVHLFLPRTARADGRCGPVPDQAGGDGNPRLYARQDREPAAAGGQTTSPAAAAGSRASRSSSAARSTTRGSGETAAPEAVPMPKKFGGSEELRLPKTSPPAGVPEGAEQGGETGKAGTAAGPKTDRDRSRF